VGTKIGREKAIVKDNDQAELPPSNNSKLLVPGSESDWLTEDAYEDIQSLEKLLDRVDAEVKRGREIPDILRRRLLPQKTTFNGQPVMTDEEYIDYKLNFYRTKTSKGYKPAIGIRHLRADVWDVVYLITRSPEEFPGEVLRVVSIIETCMIHIGLHGLDLLLVGRPKLVTERKEAIRRGSKERRRRGKPAHYTFINFTDSLDKQQNVWCLSTNDYARAATIAEDYGWDMGFVVQMAMIIAIANSETLPENLRKDAVEEVEYFKEYLNKVY